MREELGAMIYRFPDSGRILSKSVEFRIPLCFSPTTASRICSVNDDDTIAHETTTKQAKPKGAPREDRQDIDRRRLAATHRGTKNLGELRIFKEANNLFRLLKKSNAKK